MGCGCKDKNKTVVNTSPKTSYDFSADSDFVLVEYVSKFMKSVKTFTNIAEFYTKYGITSYGTQSTGSQFWILQSDFVAHNNTNNGIVLELVSIEPEETVMPPMSDALQDVSTDIVVETKTDDLTNVKHIGNASQTKLNDLGYYMYEDLKSLTLETWLELSKLNNEDSFNEMQESVNNILNE